MSIIPNQYYWLVPGFISRLLFNGYPNILGGFNHEVLHIIPGRVLGIIGHADVRYSIVQPALF